MKKLSKFQFILSCLVLLLGFVSIFIFVDNQRTKEENLILTEQNEQLLEVFPKIYSSVANSIHLLKEGDLETLYETYSLKKEDLDYTEGLYGVGETSFSFSNLYFNNNDLFANVHIYFGEKNHERKVYWSYRFNKSGDLKSIQGGDV